MAELVELKCPNCGGQLEWMGGPAHVVCPHCGTQFLVPSEVAEYLACPKCGKVDRVQKVSAAYRAGLSVLAPPPKPTRYADIADVGVGEGCKDLIIALPMATVWSLFILGFCFLLCVALSRPAYGEPTTDLPWRLLALLIIIASPFLVGTLWIVWRRRAFVKGRLAVEKERWDGAILRWEHLYHCARDDGVFVPGETSLTPIGELQSYLYAD